MKELKSLYNGIMNDYSIMRNSMGWKDVVEQIERRYKKIKRTNETFEDELILNALSVTKGSLHKKIECFAMELSMNMETLREKKSNRGTQRSPFGIGS
jgi:hypothetical protein